MVRLRVAGLFLYYLLILMNNYHIRNADKALLGKRNNILLLKDEVGKAKPSTRDLPD
jgi:hypothetical protein